MPFKYSKSNELGRKVYKGAYILKCESRNGRDFKHLCFYTRLERNPAKRMLY